MGFKRYEELTFTDDFMFCKVLEQNEELCRELVELILDTKIEIVKGIRRQQPIEITPDGRGVRLDVRMEGDDTIYELEMQNGHRAELPKRARYYQALMDLDLMERGAKYTELQDSVLIFICTFDPLGRGRSRYIVKRTVEYEPDLPYNDGARIVYLSALPGRKDELSDGLRAFLDYVGGEAPHSELTRRVDEAIRRARSQREWRKEYMLLSEIRDEGREEGRAEGREEGRAEGLAEGREEGLTEGREIEREDLIRRIAGNGKSAEEIAEMTGLPLDTVLQMIGSDDVAEQE